MAKQDRLAALVIAAASALFIVLGLILPGAGGTADEEEAVVYDLYRAHGDRYCHLGDTVTFEAQVIPYFEASAVGDAGAEDPLAPEEAEDGDESEEAEGAEAEEIDYSQFQFQWYYCQHIAETGEITYVPIEGANEPSYTIDRVTEADLYDNDELEFLLAMFPADETDLSYGNRANISSIWFCCTVMPDYVAANEPQTVTCDPAGEASEGDFVAFATDQTGEFEVTLSEVSDPDATVGLYMATIHDGAVVTEDEFDVSGSFTYAFDAANSYVLSWYTDSDEPVSFTYEIAGDAGMPYWFSAAELTPSEAGLNAYVDAVTIRGDGEYQLTVENPWVDATYASSDESVATVSDDGKIWAVAPGETTVTVSQGGETAEVVVTVVEA